MQRLILDVSDLEFQAGGPFTPRTEGDGSQRRDKETGLPLWGVNLVVWSGEGDKRRADTILVSVATDNPPSLDQMDFVNVKFLEAVPWVPKNGPATVRIAYKAESVLKQESAPKPVKAAS